MRLSNRHKEFLYLEISKLLKAGFPIEKAAASILDQDPPAVQELYLESLVESLSRGTSISGATAAIPIRGVSALERNIIDAGERGGRLEHAYRHLADYFSLLNRTATTIRGQLIYPAILIHLAVLLPAIPKAIFSGDGGAVMRNAVITLLLAYVVCGLLWFAYRQFASAGTKSETIDRFLNRIPLSGNIRKLFGLARFSAVLKTYLLSGQRTAEAVDGAAGASLSGSIDCAAARMVPSIAAGSPLGKEMKSETAFPKDFKRAVATSEEAGALDEEAGRWEAVFLERAESATQKLSIWFPKIVYFVAVGVMAWQIISMYASYLGALTNMLDAPI